MELDYKQKEDIMKLVFAKWATPTGFRSTYKGVPMDNYEGIKQFIDFTKYYVMFRGPRPEPGFKGSTRKRNAKAFDLYVRSVRDTIILRTEREAFMRGVNWANNRSH
jgi:hypothetical protein